MEQNRQRDRKLPPRRTTNKIAFQEHYFHKEIYSLRRWIELISLVSLKTFSNLYFQKINNTKESALENEWYSNYILFY